MKLAIVGSRTFSEDYINIFNIFNEHFTDGEAWTIDTIISGGASGADKAAKNFCGVYGVTYIEFPAMWGIYGKSAGFKRNQQIVDACDMVLAFWDGYSSGTKDTIERAKQAKKPAFIVYF